MGSRGGRMSSHYRQSKLEPWTVIMDWASTAWVDHPECVPALANILKYSNRLFLKGQTESDAKKIAVYALTLVGVPIQAAFDAVNELVKEQEQDGKRKQTHDHWEPWSGSGAEEWSVPDAGGDE